MTKTKIALIIGVLTLITGVSVAGEDKPRSKLSQRELYELQRTCSRDARDFFNRQDFEGFSLPDYDNHYNVKLNKCFIRIHFTRDTGSGFWAHFVVYDVNENVEYEHLTYYVTGLEDQKILGEQYMKEEDRRNEKALKEFEKRIRPYMTE